MNLFVDTSSKYLIFSLFDNTVKAMKIIETNKNQSELFINELDDFLTSNDITLKEIDMFFFAQGPGSFTGIRVGLSFAKALRVSGYSNVYTIDSLDYLFDNYNNDEAIIDARSNRYFYKEIKDGNFEDAIIIDAEKIRNINDVKSYDNSLKNICNNVIQLVAMNKYSTNLESNYIKEAF